MSDQKPQSESQEEQSSGGLSLEAKAGLTLICLLAAAFSFMVWQKWKEMDGTQVSEKQETQEVQEKAGTQNRKSAAKEAPKNPERELINPQSDPFEETSEPEIVALNVSENEKSSLPPTLNVATPNNELEPEENPFITAEHENNRRPANIPTLEAPAESPGIATSNTTEGFDPFGEEFKPAQKDPEEKPEPAATPEVTLEDNFNPFASETEATEPRKTTPAELKPANELAETEVDPFTSDPKKSSAEMKPDSFATTVDPFAESVNEPEADPEPMKTESEPPTLDFALEEPQPEITTEPPKTVAADPFGELESAPDPFTEAAEEKKTVEATPVTSVTIIPGDTFQDPLPLLERVPDQEPKSPQSDPFGGYESVPAGAAQASSITQVAPDVKRKGTLAELNAPASTNLATAKNSSPLDDNPFATPQPKPVANEFQLNPDGTYTIRQGDSYWLISRKAYGSSRYYRALAEYNRKVIPDPLQMTAGKKLTLPPQRELELKLSHLIPEGAPAPSPSIVMASAEQETGFFTDEQGNPMYRIQENDTLTGISLRHLGRSSRWIQIYELNRDKLANPNQLKIGTMLKLPGDASRVRTVRGK